MNTAIIFLIIFFVLLILGVIGYFVYKYYNTNKIQAPCPENDISNYNINDTPLKPSDLLQRIFTRLSIVMNRIREKFDLSPGTVTSISSMIPGTRYTRGTLKSGVSNTLTGVKNGGINNCSPFPQIIYTPVSPQSISLNTVQCIRIVRIGLDGNGDRGIISFADIKIYDGNGTLISPPVASYRDINGNTINGLSGFPASNITDNNMTTFCHTQGNTDYVQLTLPSPILISRIVLTNRQDCCKSRVENIQVQTFPSIPSQGIAPSTTFNITDTRDTYSITYSSSSKPIISPAQSPVQTIASQGYKYVDGIPYYFLRLNNTGDIECLSLDGINCIETADETELEKLLNTFMVFDNKPVVCGPSLLDIEGTIGYDLGEHRCNMAMKVLNPTSPKLACEPYIYGSPEPVSRDCYMQLWSNAGCGGDPFVMPGLEDDINSGRIYDSLRAEANTIAYQAKVLKDPYYMEYCL